MGQALYRKYRSRSFKDVVGQDHIIKTLQNAIKSGKISHAYLFTGPRGVGKTSVARILAHEVNGLSYSDESIHLDIIEIDAASNRRIDEIRDLRERVRVAPTSGKYKVYIIDEVHMLTREAFNALLKTLEEPPAHCIFILATTEAHKLPETIISRTQRFEFRPVSNSQAAKHLSDIAQREKIDISAEALELLGEFGNGSFRDSIGYLDQLSSLDRKISEDDVRTILGLPPLKAIDNLLDLIRRGQSGRLLSELIKIEEQGVNPVAIAGGLSSKLRHAALEDSISSPEISLLKELSRVSSHSHPQEALEIALLESVAQSPKTTDNVIKSEKIPLARQQSPDPQTPTGGKSDFSLNQWEDVVGRAKSEAASIYTALRLAKPGLCDSLLTLEFQFPLHQKKLNQAKNKELVAKIVQEVSGSSVQIEAVVADRKNSRPLENINDGPPPSAIHNIFGGAEVMEA